MGIWWYYASLVTAIILAGSWLQHIFLSLPLFSRHSFPSTQHYPHPSTLPPLSAPSLSCRPLSRGEREKKRKAVSWMDMFLFSSTHSHLSSVLHLHLAAENHRHTESWLQTELQCQEQSRTMLVSIGNTAKQPTPTSCEHSDTQLFYELTSQVRIYNRVHLLSMQLSVINKLFML